MKATGGPVIFLDIDGVLNSFVELRREHDKSCVAALNRLVTATGARIVVSSSLRSYGLLYMRRLLRRLGVRGVVVDVTPALPEPGAEVERGDEIAAWLAAHPEVTTFVILDDNDDMGRLRPWLVQTDAVYGLTDADVRRAVDVLAGRR